LPPYFAPESIRVRYGYGRLTVSSRHGGWEVCEAGLITLTKYSAPRSVLWWDHNRTQQDNLWDSWIYLPMQNLLKMRRRMSSLVVEPVRLSRD
jgi:hypothetical protein